MGLLGGDIGLAPFHSTLVIVLVLCLDGVASKGVMVFCTKDTHLQGKPRSDLILLVSVSVPVEDILHPIKKALGDQRLLYPLNGLVKVFMLQNTAIKGVSQALRQSLLGNLQSPNLQPSYHLALAYLRLLCHPVKSQPKYLPFLIDGNNVLTVNLPTIISQWRLGVPFPSVDAGYHTIVTLVPSHRIVNVGYNDEDILYLLSQYIVGVYRLVYRQDSDTPFLHQCLIDYAIVTVSAETVEVEHDHTVNLWVIADFAYHIHKLLPDNLGTFIRATELPFHFDTVSFAVLLATALLGLNRAIMLELVFA